MNTANPVFSLIVATLGRDNELRSLFNSLSLSSFDCNCIEVILVDQNIDDRCLPVVDDFCALIPIFHYKVNFRGLSRARNFGLAKAKGDYICYPDDDCTYYVDTLIEAYNAFYSSPHIDVFVGQIIDRCSSRKLFKPWPFNPTIVNDFNFYLFSSSIVLFHKKLIGLSFDDLMGAGAKYGSCEDADFLRACLHNHGSVLYVPTICVWHPEPDISSINANKVLSYAAGFGFLLRKHFNFTSFVLLLLFLAKRIVDMLFIPFPITINYIRGFLLGILGR